MPLPVMLTWLVGVATFVVLNLVIALRFGYRAALLPVLFGFVPPILFFPFAFDAQNVASLGPYQFRRVYAHLPEAWYLFGTTGMVFMIALFVVATQKRSRTPAARLGFFDRSMTKLVIDDSAANGLLAVEVALFLLLIAGGFRYGAGTFSAFENTALRPVMNAANSLFSLGVLLSAIRLMNRRTVGRALVLVVTLFVGGLSGQRGVTLIPLIIFSLIFMSVRGIRISIWPAVLAIVMLPLALAISDYRSSAVPINGRAVARTADTRGIVAKLAYGNQFSDIRDLSWIMSGFDGHYLMGKSYLAGYTPFVPSRYWSFRRQWGFGDWTVRQAGLDPEHHGGLRGGFFSELYFNFGLVAALLGALVSGLVYGRILRHEVDHDLTVADRTRRSAIALSSYTKATVLLSVMFTPGFYGVPVAIALLLVVDGAVRLRPAALPSPLPAA